MKKKGLSILLVLCMVLTMLPTAAFGGDATGVTIAGVELNSTTPYLVQGEAKAVIELPTETENYAYFDSGTLELHNMAISTAVTERHGVYWSDTGTLTIKVFGTCSITADGSGIYGGNTGTVKIVDGDSENSLTVKGKQNGIQTKNLSSTMTGDLTVEGNFDGISISGGTLDIQGAKTLTIKTPTSNDNAILMYSTTSPITLGATGNIVVTGVIRRSGINGAITITSSKGNVALSSGLNPGLDQPLTIQAGGSVNGIGFAGDTVAITAGTDIISTNVNVITSASLSAGNTLSGFSSKALGEANATLSLAGTLAEGNTITTTKMDITVPEGKTLTNNGTITMDKGCTFSADGTLEGKEPMFPTNVYVGSDTMLPYSEDTLYFHNDGTTADAADYNYAYDNSSATLTLNGADIRRDTNCIYAEKELNLVLQGDNKLDGDGGNALDCDANLNLSGEGTLTCDSLGYIPVAVGGSLSVKSGTLKANTLTKDLDSTGIDVTGNITIDDGTLIGFGSIDGIEVSKSIIVNGGTLIGKGDTNGFGVSGNITVDGGTLVGEGKKKGIDVSEKFSISSGVVTATATGKEGSNSISGIKVSDDLEISGGVVTAIAQGNGSKTYGINTDTYTTTITGGVVTASGTTLAIYTEDSCTIADGSFTFKAGADKDSTENITTERPFDKGSDKYVYVSYVKSTPPLDFTNTTQDKGDLNTDGYHWDAKNLTLTLKNLTLTGDYGSDNGAIILPAGNCKLVVNGTNTIANTTSNARAIYAKGSMTVSGTGTLNATSKGNGIEAKEKLTFTGGTINAKGEKTALCSGTGILLSGTRITSPAGAVVGDSVKNAGSKAIVLNGTDVQTVTIEKTSSSGGGSSSGGSGGGSSSNTTTDKVTNSDGSTTTTVDDKKTGTVTETTKKPDGSSVVTETKKDGTVTETVKDTVGNTTETITKPDGSSTTTEKTTNGVETVTKTDKNGNTTTTVTVPSNVKEEVTVNIPTDLGKQDGTVSAEITYPDGTKETAKGNYTKGKLSITVADSATIEILDDFVPLTAEQPSQLPFTDVKGHWASDSITYAYTNGLFAGITDTTFVPDATMTRGMLWTVLYRQAGSPAIEGADTSLWYDTAQKWAMANDISDGGNPDNAITREQLVSILYRYAQLKGYDTTQGGMAIREFSDYSQISEYAKTPMAWAVHTGLVSGVGENTLDPQGNATRGQVATILMGFCEKIVK